MSAMNWKIVLICSIFFYGCGAVPLGSSPQVFGQLNLSKKPSTNWTKWERCPEGAYVVGISFLFPSESDDTLKGIRLACRTTKDPLTDRYEIGAIAPNYDGISRLWNDCGLGGLGVGLQQRVSQNIWSGKSSEKIPEVWKTGVIEAVLYCEDLGKLTKIEEFNAKNSMVSPAKWRKPFLCGWGELLCSVRAQFGGSNLDKMLNIQTSCCPAFETEDIPVKTNRMLSGIIKESSVPDFKISEKRSGKVYDHHFTSEMDSPYYYKWKFCEVDHYVTGMQIKHGKRGVGLLCSDMKRPKPRQPQIIQMNGNEAEWEASSDELSEQIECEGVAIGFQVKYNEKAGIQSIRLICSFSATATSTNELTYVESRFKNSKNGSSNEWEWQEAQMCDRNQAICGFKAYTHRFGEFRDFLEHFKVKCCQVPEIADVCFATDRFELLVECDATMAMAETTCTYTQSEGMSISHSLSASEKRDLEFHQSLGREWNIIEGQTERDSEGTSSSNTTSKSTGETVTDTENESQGGSIASGADVSLAQGSGSSKTASSSTGTNTNQIQSESNGTDTSSGTSQRKGNSMSAGQSEGNTKGSTSGRSQSSSSTHSTGSTEETSQSDTEGTSRGTLKATMHGSSNSQSRTSQSSSSNSETNSESTRSSSSSSNTHGWNVGFSKSVEAGFNAGFASGSVRTSFEAGFHGSYTRGSEQSSERGSSRTTETSHSNSNTASSETSRQDTSQQTSEDTKSRTSGTSSQARKDNTESTGTEESTGTSSQATLEKNKQQTQSTDTEASKSETLRTNTENQVSTGKNTQTEIGESSTADQRSENRNTTTTTHNREVSKGITKGSNSETGQQLSGTVSHERIMERTGSRTRGISDTGGKRFNTGFNWDKASTSTWNMERSTEVRMTVPPGMRTRLYQAVGHCAFYTVRTTFYKRVDHSLFNVDLNETKTDDTQTKPVVLDSNQVYLTS